MIKRMPRVDVMMAAWAIIKNQKRISPHMLNTRLADTKTTNTKATSMQTASSRRTDVKITYVGETGKMALIVPELCI